MTIHLEQIIHEITQMSSALGAGDRREWLRQARRLLREHDRGRLATKLALHRNVRSPLLAPQPLGDLEERIPAPPAPVTHVVVAADGSNIAPERSSPVRFYVLNMGLVTLAYGEEPGATITSQAQLYYRPEDLYWGEKRQRPVDAQRLSLLMRVEEIAALPALVAQVAEPCIALVDGQLILWALQGEEAEDRERLLGRLMDALEQLREMRVPVVGYISDTESFELVNTLKIYLCPTSPDRCQQCHARGAAEVQLCYHLNDFRDPALLFNFLEAGERSCCFASHAEILKQYDEAQQIVYFFMSTGDEIARVEVPRWVAEERALLDQVHALLHDQCARSGQQPPYPPALHEAHEAAVISVGERASIQMLIEEALERSGIPPLRPAKSYHKRLRGV